MQQALLLQLAFLSKPCIILCEKCSKKLTKVSAPCRLSTSQYSDNFYFEITVSGNGTVEKSNFICTSLPVSRTQSANLGCLWCVAGNRYCEWRMTRTFHSCWWATWSTWKSSVRSHMRKPWSGPRSGASPTWKPLPKPASMWTRLVVSVVWHGQNWLDGWVLLTGLCSSLHSMCWTWRVVGVYCTLLILVWDSERLHIHAVHFLWCDSCCMVELALILNWVNASHFRHFSFNQGFLTPRTHCFVHLPFDEHAKLTFFQTWL